MEASVSSDILRFSGPLTDELFEQWLDDLPGRRDHHNRLLPNIQREERARIARLFALRKSEAAQDLSRVAELARQLRAAALGFYQRHDKDCAAAALAAAGLEVPGEDDFRQDCGADFFNESRDVCRRVARVVAKFLDLLDSEVRFVLSTSPESVRGAA